MEILYFTQVQQNFVWENNWELFWKSVFWKPIFKIISWELIKHYSSFLILCLILKNCQEIGRKNNKSINFLNRKCRAQERKIFFPIFMYYFCISYFLLQFTTKQKSILSTFFLFPVFLDTDIQKSGGVLKLESLTYKTKQTCNFRILFVSFVHNFSPT